MPIKITDLRAEPAAGTVRLVVIERTDGTWAAAVASSPQIRCDAATRDGAIEGCRQLIQRRLRMTRHMDEVVIRVDVSFPSGDER